MAPALPFALLALALLVTLAFLFRTSRSLFVDLAWGMVFNALCFAVGFSVAQNTRPLSDVQEFKGMVNFTVLVEKNEGVVNERTRYVARLFSVDSQRFDSKTLKIRLMTDTLWNSFREGEMLYCKGVIRKIENRGNPGEFDYKTWANRRQIYYNTTINENRCSSLGYHKPLFLQVWVSQIRDWLQKTFVNNGITDNQLAVLTALTTGDKASLDPELRSAFSTAGLMHVLAVSGLHIGIIYLILSWIVKPLAFYRVGKLLQISIVIVFLWLYAFFTGMAPSVSRAVLMFSFLVIGEASGRKYASENALFASAFFLVLVDPNIIYEVGFQLSYLAVFGIFQFYKPIYNLFYFEHKIPDKIWSLCALSLAAQLATTPISLYYFNQFPTWFLLSNLLIVPLVGFIIQGTLILLAISFVEPAARVVAWCVNLMLKGMTGYSEWVVHLPASLLSGIYLDTVLLLGMYAFIFLLFSFFHNRSPKFLQLTSITLLLLLGYGIATAHWQSKKRDIHVYRAMHNPVFIVEANRVHSIQTDTSVPVQRYVSQLSSFYKTNLTAASHHVVHDPVSVWDIHRQKILLLPGLPIHKVDSSINQRFKMVVARDGVLDNRLR
jgi:competence protein ComEC